MNLEAQLNRARAWIEEAQRIVVLSGAGISTESGIQDFRGPQGLWTKNPGAERMATLHAYVEDEAVRVQSWQTFLERSADHIQPNAGHRALVEMERLGKLDTLITQNVDGLHHDAGNSPAKIVEIHGTLREVKCLRCGERGSMAGALERVRAGERDLHCLACGGVLKSATIAFGENLVFEDLCRAEEAASRCDLLLAVGTSLGVYPAAGVVPIAKRNGARIVIVNAEPTEMDDLADVVLRGSIGELLPQLVRVSP